ncbi:MAG TPA: SPFH domain-containing protein [Magnetospirillaceae bacterium]|nr:SPFH domain-containing protein [Magnetospirillaceae bacterium]
MDTVSALEERPAPRLRGMAILILNILFTLGAVAGTVIGAVILERDGVTFFWLALTIKLALQASLIGPLVFSGLKVLRPNEALVLTLFGKYYGTLRGPGYFFVNPFTAAASQPNTGPTTALVPEEGKPGAKPGMAAAARFRPPAKRISLKAMTLCNDRQKVNDSLGNPIIIGIVVVWRVVNTARAVFNVDNYLEYLSIQCDSALRNIVSLYPYDASDEDGKKSLRGSSQEIADRLKTEIQGKVELAGLEVMEARITHLFYAPEIAVAMLQRQQATAVIAARQMIVEGAVGMVELALDKLSDKNIVNLDEERKAAMVSNLLVVLCGNKDAQPVVNSGSIY